MMMTSFICVRTDIRVSSFAQWICAARCDSFRLIESLCRFYSRCWCVLLCCCYRWGVERYFCVCCTPRIKCRSATATKHSECLNDKIAARTHTDTHTSVCGSLLSAEFPLKLSAFSLWLGVSRAHAACHLSFASIYFLLFAHCQCARSVSFVYFAFFAAMHLLCALYCVQFVRLAEASTFCLFSIPPDSP